MKTLITLFSFSCLVLAKMNAQNNPESDWLIQIGGTGSVTASGISTDSKGNVFIAGNFHDTIDFDPSSEAMNVIAKNTKKAYSSDVFIQKLDQNGKLCWVKNIGGTSFRFRCNSFVLDSLDNIILTGVFRGTIDFNPGEDINILNSNGRIDVFVLKLDSNGNFIWVKQLGGNSSNNFSTNNTGESITVDQSNNICIVGHFQGTTDFDPGKGVKELSSTRSYSADTFILKLNSNGNLVWVKQFGGIGGANGKSILTDSLNSIFISGSFYDTINNIPDSKINYLSAKGESDIFILKLDASGKFKWVKQIGGKGVDYITSMTIDPFNNLLITGIFSNLVDFDPSFNNLNLSSNGWGDMFVLKMDTSGHTVWARKYGGGSTDFGHSLTTDYSGNCYVIGSFDYDFELPEYLNDSNLITKGKRDIVILKINPKGNLIWYQHIGGKKWDRCNSITSDNNNIYFTGQFNDQIGFYNDSTETFLTPNTSGKNDFYIQKINHNSTER